MANGPLYLTLLAGQVEAVPVPKPVMDTFVSAQVTEAATGQSGFELTFTLANDSPLQALILVGNSPVPLLRVILAATWGGLPQVLIDGVIEHTEVHPSATGGSARLVVKGSDLTAVIHAAGVVEDAPVTALTESALGRVLASKAVSAWNLHEATRTGAAPAYAYCAGMVVKAAERARDAINIVVPPDIRHSISSN